ncbi:AAA family ATPase [Salipiger pacificus]|nr:AAA family ATPase [Alloyangia pacifica]
MAKDDTIRNFPTRMVNEGTPEAHCPDMLRAIFADRADPHGFLCWVSSPNAKNPDRLDKIPVDPETGRIAKGNSARERGILTLEEALSAAAEHHVGVGGVPGRLGLIAPDYDAALTTQGRLIKPVAEVIGCEGDGTGAGAYFERSPSGTGLRGLLVGKVPYDIGSGTERGGYGFYFGESKFVTLTGNHWAGPIEIREAQDIIDRTADAMYRANAKSFGGDYSMLGYHGAKDVERAEKAIISGAELHAPLMFLSAHWARTRHWTDADQIEFDLYALMEQSSEKGSERWHERMSNIPRWTKGALALAKRKRTLTLSEMIDHCAKIVEMKAGLEEQRAKVVLSLEELLTGIDDPLEKLWRIEENYGGFEEVPTEIRDLLLQLQREAEQDAKIEALSKLTQPVEGLKYVWGRLAARRKITIIAGPGGDAKSTVMVSVGIGLGTGTALVGPEPAAAMPVVYVNFEDDHDDVALLTAAAFRHHQIKDRALGGRFKFLGKDTARQFVGLDADEQLGWFEPGKELKPNQKVIKAIRRLASKARSGVLILDPLASLYGGTEMGNAAVNAVSRGLAEIAAEFDCAIIPISHMVKTAKTSKARNVADVKFGGELTDTARSALVTNDPSDEDLLRWKVKPGEVHSLRVVKTNIGEMNAEFWYRVEITEIEAKDGTISPAPVAVSFQPPAEVLPDLWTIFQKIEATLAARFVKANYSRFTGKDDPDLIDNVLQAAVEPGTDVKKLYQRLLDQHVLKIDRQVNPNGSESKVQRVIASDSREKLRTLLRSDAPDAEEN